MSDKQILKDILKNKSIITWFQPVINTETMTTMGWGALARGPSVTPFHSPIALLDGAEKAGLLKPMELMCVTTAMTNFEQLLLGGKLFINVSHEMLFAGEALRKQFRKMVKTFPIPASKVILELNIRGVLEDVPKLKDAIEFFHELGFQIAIDNLGSGVWPQNEWYLLGADYVKLDRHMINHCDTDTLKQEFIFNAALKARATNTKVIAEGVETIQELKAINGLGINLAQGYLFQRPQLSPVNPNRDELNKLGALLEDVFHA
jgi:EAL domain-containing protein (putative c-di-GMP-specific phosphodiesterase class I)